MKVWSGQLLFFVFVMLLDGHLAGRDGPKKPPSQPVLQLDHRLELPSYSTDEVTVGLQVRVKVGGGVKAVNEVNITLRQTVT